MANRSLEIAKELHEHADSFNNNGSCENLGSCPDLYREAAYMLESFYVKSKVELLEETRRLVACYMNEGEAELDEEDEYKELCQKPKDKRTHEENGRLRDLARMIPHLLNSIELRAMVRKAWNRKSSECPYCDVNLVTDYHLKNCPLGVVLAEDEITTPPKVTNQPISTGMNNAKRKQ